MTARTTSSRISMATSDPDPRHPGVGQLHVLDEDLTAVGIQVSEGPAHRERLPEHPGVQRATGPVEGGDQDVGGMELEEREGSRELDVERRTGHHSPFETEVPVG